MTAASARTVPGFDVEAFLERVGYTGAVQPTAEGLEAIHRAQAYTIPFENFDVLLGRGIDLEPAAVFDKLVGRRRGGYCFELNGLLLIALEALGFDARALLARVHVSGTPGGRSHMLLLVTLADRQWIADVGFGGPGLRAPIPFELERVCHQDGQTFRLVAAEPFGIMLQTLNADTWQNLYSFDLAHVITGDIAYANYFTSTHPASFFTYARVAALPRPEGRTTLFDLRLTTTRAGSEQVRTLPEGPAYLDALVAEFGIVLDADYTSIRPLTAAR